MIVLVFYFSLAIGVSFLCSILEAVLLSMTPSYIASLKKAGHPGAARMEALKGDPEKPLAAILSLNTIAHTVGAAGVGAQAQAVFQSIPVGVISAVLTLLILIFSEIIPKTLGANYWRALAGPSSIVTHGLTLMLWPLVWISMWISRSLAREGGRPGISRDEIAAMAELGMSEGVISRAETRALRGVMQFRTLTVDNVLTPRVVTMALRADWSVEEVLRRHPEPGFSRLPVQGESPDEILGYVRKTDILQAAAQDRHQQTVRELTQPVIIVPESAPAAVLFRRFLREREHIAVVVDEYGSFAGVVTLEDLIESFIGEEIMDEADEVADLRQWAASRQKASRPEEEEK